MLRADVLDMMDFSLRHIRRNPNKFGGVQMLFIGDLYQLPPVVRDENEYMMKKYPRFHGLISWFITLGVAEIVFPSNYYVCIKEG